MTQNEWYKKAEAEINPVMAQVARIINAKREHPVKIEYFVETEESIQSYPEFHRRYHHMRPGRECIYIWEIRDDLDYLLYVVNVEGDSILTAIYEAMNLIAEKF